MFKQRHPVRVILSVAGPLLLATLMGCIAIETNEDTGFSIQQEDFQLQADQYELALEEAMQAAESAQSAQTSSEWELVADNWNAAIGRLRRVNQGSPNYDAAQGKIEEYRVNRDYAKQQASEAEPSTVFTRAQICKATISAVMGRDPSIIKIDSEEEGIVYLSYIRPDDGQEWKSKCKLNSQSVIWASEPDGRWRTDDMDTEISFSINADEKQLTIKETFSDGSSNEDTFNLSQL